MADISNVNNYWNTYTNDYSYLFGNFSSSNSSNNSTTSNILGIDFAEYSSITRGSYSKLIKAYYEKYGKDSAKKTVSTEDKSETVAKTTIKGNANELYKAAETLVTNGKESVFNKVEIKDEEAGTTTKGYDTDKIYKAVNSMVEAYNALIENSTESTDNAVLRQTLHMIHSVSANGSLLADMGVSIGEDNKLTLDEETFKNADMNMVKTIFKGTGSLGSKIQSAASNIYLKVNNSLGNGNFYTSSGTLGNYSSGNILDSLL